MQFDPKSKPQIALLIAANCCFNVNSVHVDQPALKQAMIAFTRILINLILVITWAKITKRKS